MNKKIIQAIKRIPYFGSQERWYYSKIKSCLQKTKPFNPYTAIISLDKVLIGQQNGQRSEDWIRNSGDYARISVLLSDSPYVKLLSDIEYDRSLLENAEFLESHPYYKMAIKSIRHHGAFFGVSGKDEIFILMKNFFKMYENFGAHKRIGDYSRDAGHSVDDSPIKLNKIKYSDYYEIVDGHHRASCFLQCGNKEIQALIVDGKTTFIQNLILSCRQTHGALELYQPVNKPEVSGWHVVRLCSDRLEMIDGFIAKNGFEQGISSLLDISCSYGWFLKEFKKRGIKVKGVEADPEAVKVGMFAYGLEESDFAKDDACRFLMDFDGVYDAVLFLSIIHHYGIGKEKSDLASILRRLDAITGKVLFIDSGQDHEAWYRERLSGWNDQFLEKIIRINTSFNMIVRLGQDHDNRGKYADQYGRTLFACIR